MQLTDSSIIHREGDREVLAQRHEVMWPDGTAVNLHPVRVAGVPDTYLRALQLDAQCWVIFDLRRVARQLGEDIARSPARDAIGLVFYTLRQAYPSAGYFRQAVLVRADQAVRPVRFHATTGSADFLKPDTHDRRVWPVGAA